MTDLRNWDGTENMPWVFDDGGRKETGRKGFTGDCVTRAICIAAQMPYHEVYQHLAMGNAEQRKPKNRKAYGRTASHGIYTKRKWFKDFMQSLGFEWTPTMLIGQGCKVHLLKGELPMGRLVVHVTRHSLAVIDGVIHDTFDSSRATIFTKDGIESMSHRCVYGYWKMKS